MTKILTACVGVLVLATLFSTQVNCQNTTPSNSSMTNTTSFSSTTLPTLTSRNGTNSPTPNGAGPTALPAGLSLLLPVGLLGSVLHGHW